MDGFEVCRRLKEQPSTREVPVIFISALNDPESLLRGFGAGGVDYIVKPFQREEVLVRVDTHLTIKKQRQGMQAQQEFLRTLINLIPNSLFYKDLSGRILGCNKSFARLLDSQIEKVIDSNFFDWFDQKTAGDFKRTEADLLNKRGVIKHGTSIVMPDGNKRDLVVYMCLFQDDNWHTAGFLGSVQDFTEINRTHNRLLDLEKRDSALAMAVTANHEMNQPLMILQGSLDLLRMSLQGTDLTPQQENCLVQADVALSRLSGILEKMKNIDAMQFTHYEGREPMLEMKE